ncbi:MAG: hypothetical protein LBF85_07390 [Tannerella sp.]|nr:hypothetical protein [Tannerella sp.]
MTCFVICLLSARRIASYLEMTPDAIAGNNGIPVIANGVKQSRASYFPDCFLLRGLAVAKTKCDSMRLT